MAVLFIGVTVPLALIGTASAFGTAIGLGLTVLGDERGPRVAFGSLAVLACCLVAAGRPGLPIQEQVKTVRRIPILTTNCAD